MKVLITTTYWKGCPGGIRPYLENMVEELEKRGIEVRVVFKEGFDPENYKIQEKAHFIKKLVLAFRIIMEIKPQIIHSHGGMYYYLVAGYIYKKIYGAKIIYTFHTDPTKNDGLPFLKRAALQILLNRCDKVTFVSKSLEFKVKEIWGLKFKNCSITYAGVKSMEVSESSKRIFRQRFDIKEDSIVLLALGLTALSYKAEGLKLLIGSIKKIKERYPNILLVATRGGHFLNEVREFSIEEGMEKNVIFTGDIDDTFSAIAICDIYMHITLAEGGLSLALLEAMSMGKPIIATRVGGIPEAIEDGNDGLLVEPDIDEIAEKIVYLLQNKNKAEEIGRSAKRTAEEKFTWKAAVDKILKVYTENVLSSEEGS